MPTIDDLKQAYIAATGTYPPRLDTYTGPVTDQDILNVQQMGGGGTTAPAPAPTPTGGTTSQVTFAQVSALFTDLGVNPAFHADGTEVDPTARINGIVAQINRGERTLDSVKVDIQRFYFPAGGTTTKVSFAEVMALFDDLGVDPGFEADGTPIDPNVRINRIVSEINTGKKTLELVRADIEKYYFGGNVLPKPGSWTDQLGGTPALWKDTTNGKSYIVYNIPGTSVPLLYYTTDSELKTLFGDAPIVYDQQYTTTQLNQRGALQAGIRSDVRIDTDPYNQWIQTIDSIKDVVPWMDDPEVMSLVFQSIIEQRPYTQEEFWATDWWQTHTDAQRNWLLLASSDPETAAQLIEDNKMRARDALVAAGVNQAPQALVDYMATQISTGEWSQTYFNNQIIAVSDPYAGFTVDPGITSLLNQPLDTTRSQEDTVRDLAEKWLGPTFGQWSQNQISEWAGKIRNDPDAKQELESVLRQQRMALFPEYTDPSLTYQDISAPWRQLTFNMWGEQPDETDPFFSQMIRLNDVAEASKLLRRTGLERGNRSIVEDALSGLNQTSAPSRVRRPF